MNNNKMTVMSISLSLLLLSSALNASTITIPSKDNGLKQAKLTDIEIGDYDLVAIDGVASALEQQAVHFSQAISNNNAASFKNQGHTDISDEYWFEATGKQLMLGVGIDISQPGALIRLSGKHVKNELGNIPKAIDPESVLLQRAGVPLKSAFKQKVTAAQFATANIFPNSSALQLNKAIGSGKFMLKVAQPLEENLRYMVNVKEKNAPYKLHVSIDKQSYREGQDIFFNAEVLNTHGNALIAQQKFSLKLPNGEVKRLDVVRSNKQYKVRLPQLLTTQKRGQLYELLIESSADNKGKLVRRNGKVAFAMNAPTARLEGKVKHAADSVVFNINVASEGRYEISGIVYGVNQQGKSVPFMLSRSAYYLPAGVHKRSLKLDSTLMRRSGLQAPYMVKEVQLMDQSRLALLQQL